MSPFRFIHNMFLKINPQTRDAIIFPMTEQVKAWCRANQKMGWGIENNEFIGAALFYGFGDDGRGNSNAVLSGKLAWDYALRRRKTWQCEYVNFNKPEDIRLRPEAPDRPQGFYLAKITSGERFLNLTVAQVRKKLEIATGWGPEGFQFLAITHPHFADLMNERKIPFMALADYDVAPYGFNDFYDAPQLFCSNSKLGLGIGNVDRNYPLFGIPTLHLTSGLETPTL